MAAADLGPHGTLDRVFNAIAGDDHEVLRRHMEASSPSTRTSLFHFSITANKYEIFSFLLSLDYFDRQEINFAFRLTLICYDAATIFRQEQFVLDLIAMGADDFYFVDREGNTALHIALKRHFCKVARVLIERGVGLEVENNEGCTPFHVIFYTGKDSAGANEATALMIYYGADCQIHDKWGYLPFDLSVINYPGLVTTHETLLYSTFDQHSLYKMPTEVLLRLLQSPSALFFQIVDHVSEIVFSTMTPYISPTLFLRIKPEYLRIMIDRFDYVLSRFLRTIYPVFWDDIQHTINFENWEMLLNSHLALDTVEFIGRVRIEFVVGKLSEDQVHPKVVQDFVFYLLSYGVNVWKNDLDVVYNRYGYCHLFKTLLHMDIRKSDCDIFPRVIFDIHLNMDTIFDYPCTFSLSALEELLDYSARPKLKSLCYKLNSYTFMRRTRTHPALPSLVELARDSARTFLVQRFNLENSRQFYWLLNKLPISIYHKKILSFERKLYTE